MDFNFGPFSCLPPPGLLGNMGSAEASSPLLRNQHLWPSEFKTDHFRMFGLKTSQIFSRDAQVAKCPMRESHNWKQCPYQHVSENARRRDPTSIEYTTEACPMYHHGICLFGETCPFSHGVHEQLLHPAKFRTALCKRAGGCDREVCFFAHTAAELRPPAYEPQEGTRLCASHLLYSWELWHRQGDYPHGAAAFAFAAAAAAAGFRAQRPESSPGGKPGPGGHTTARMRAGIGYSHVEQMYLGEIAAAIPLFTEAYQADRGELPPEPRMANDLAVALGLKHVDMGHGNRLRRSPPGSAPASPLFGGGARFAPGPFHGTCAAGSAFGDHHQALLHAATFGAAMSAPPSRTASGLGLSRAMSDSLAQGIMLGSGLANGVAAAPAHQRRGSNGSGSGRSSAAAYLAAARSEAASDQAFEPFSLTGLTAADAVARLQQPSISGALPAGNGGAKAGTKTAAGRRPVFDIHVHASPKALASPAPLADLSNLPGGLHLGSLPFGGPLAASRHYPQHVGMSSGPFAFGAPQQLQPGLMPAAAGGGYLSPSAAAALPASLNASLNPAAPEFDPSSLTAADFVAAGGAASRGLPSAGSSPLSDAQRQWHAAWEFPIDTDAGLKAAVSAALAMSSHPRPGSAASDAAASASADCRRTANNDADALAAQMHSMAVTVSRI